MSKSTIGNIVMVLLVAIMLAAIGCAPATAPAKPAEQQKPAPAAPAAPAAKPAEKPTDTIPTAAAAPAVKTSFESATFTDSTNGISFQYPKTWVKDVTVTTEVANYGKTTNVLADHVTAFVNPEAKDIPADFKASWENVPGMKQYNAIIKIESSNAIKMADGKNDGMEMVGTCTILGSYNMWTYAIGFNKGGKTIIVTTYTFGEPGDLLKEIVKTTVVK